jgi:hypothetical protein
MRLRRCRRAPVGFDFSASEAEELKQNVFNTPSESCTELSFSIRNLLVQRVPRPIAVTTKLNAPSFRIEA